MCPCCGASLSNNKGPRSDPRYLLYLQCQFVAKVNVDDWLKKIMVEAHKLKFGTNPMRPTRQYFMLLL